MPEWKCMVRKKTGNKKEMHRFVFGPQTNEKELREHFAKTEPGVELINVKRVDGEDAVEAEAAGK